MDAVPPRQERPIRNEPELPSALIRAFSLPAGSNTFAGRLARTVAARLPTTLDDADLASRLCALGAVWLETEPGRVRTDAAGRLRLVPSVSEELVRLGRTVLWMRHPRYHHGQQAGKEAAKTLRALRADRLDFDALLAHAARFRALRQGHVRRNARDKAHAAPETVPLVGGSYQATRVVSQRHLHQLGQEAGNCLANLVHGRAYAARLRRNESGLWRIDRVEQDAPGGRQLVWTLGITTGTSTLDDVSHKRSPGGTAADRDALLEFLAGLEEPGGGTASAFAISRPLMTAVQDGTLRRFHLRVEGAAWCFETGPGVLAAFPRGSDTALGDDATSALMLHGPGTGERMVLALVQGWHDDEDAGRYMDFEDLGITAPHYRRSAAVRQVLRRACAGSRRLRQAVAEAFAAEAEEFRADWFGTALQRPRP